MDYVDRNEEYSPRPHSNHTSPDISPVAPRTAMAFGPPRRVSQAPRAASPVDEQYVSVPQTTTTNIESKEGTPTSSTSPLPSTFAKNTRAEERTAAAQVALAAQQAALSRPGKGEGKVNGKQRVWQDSDEEEEEDEDEESDENGVLGSMNSNRPLSQTQLRGPSPMDHQQLQNRMSRSFSAQTSGSAGLQEQQYYAGAPGRQSYYDNGPEQRYSPQPVNQYELEEAAAARAPKPFVNPSGLLAAGILDKEDRSARAQENLARDSGGPLLSIPPPPQQPQTGLVGAITSHQRERERTGGVGRALTDQQRDRKLAEQRQKQLDESQKQQLQQHQSQQQQMMVSIATCLISLLTHFILTCLFSS